MITSIVTSMVTDLGVVAPTSSGLLTLYDGKTNKSHTIDGYFVSPKNFKGNENFIKVVKSSAFCSENNEIISDNYKITKDQKIGIIPPIGGG